MVPQLSYVRMLRAQTSRLIRAQHRGDDTRYLVDSSLPKQRPRRVCDPRWMTMRNRMHVIKPTRYAPRINSILGFVTLTFGLSFGELPPLP